MNAKARICISRPRVGALSDPCGIAGKIAAFGRLADADVEIYSFTI